MSSKKTLRQILDASDKCFLVPCVYDCASNHAVEMCGFPVSLLSGGEVSISRNGVIDYGFTNLTDLEEVISRVASTSAIPRRYRGRFRRPSGCLPRCKAPGRCRCRCCSAGGLR